MAPHLSGAQGAGREAVASSMNTGEKQCQPVT